MSESILKEFNKRQYGGDTDVHIKLSKEIRVPTAAVLPKKKKASAELGLTFHRINEDNITTEDDTVRITMKNGVVVGAKFFIMDQ